MEDFLDELGPLALASRLRRLTERINQDVVGLYKAQDIDFEPRWFPVFYLLSRQSPLAIGDIARILGISHPAVNQIAGELVRQELVKSFKDESDRRKRLLALTAKGQDMLPALKAIWDGVEVAASGLLAETGTDVLSIITRLESALEGQGVHARFVAWQSAQAVDIIEFQPGYRDAFKTLNIEWIEKYFRVEPEDEAMLSDPESHILEPGGCILFARDRASGILGTCALIPKGEGVYELSKMAVTPKAQGRRIGQHLLTAAIEKARSLEASAVILETNSRLAPALHLYRKMGFVDVPFEEASKYERADVRMRLVL